MVSPARVTQFGSESGRRIVVFGDVIDDIVVVPTGPIRTDTDTPSSIQHRAGGSAANAASWLGELGAPVDFVGRVAEVDVLKHAGIFEGFGVTSHLVADREHPTGTIVVLVDGNQRSMLTERGANAWLSADAVTDELLDGASVVHFTGYSVYHSTDHAPLRRLFERAAQRGVTVSVDPASAGSLQDFGVPAFLELVQGAGILFPNLDEGIALTGFTDPSQIVVALAAHFPLVVLTMGVNGVVVAHADAASREVEIFTVPSEICTVVDPTGAGDSFSAGFLAAWMRGADVVEAARAGVEVAARAVRAVGGRPESTRVANRSQN
ncbi:MAG: PfkB family carbohydrate kinase [Terrimesophilobacter sp.]